MPIPTNHQTPKNWQDFERMLKDLYPDMKPYGRPGQNQDGIDLVHIDGSCVIQAKKRGESVQNITLSNLNSWVERACDFYKKIPFKKLILATTQRTDKHLQDAFIRTNQATNSPPFLVDILFWDEIEEKLDTRPDLVRKYYGSPMEDPDFIREFASGSIDAYIQTTLISSLVCRNTYQMWPSIDSIINDLPNRLNPGFGHKLNIDQLKSDYNPLFVWFYRILIEGKAVERVINKAFGQREILPIEWSSTYANFLNEKDLVAVLETEMHLLQWARCLKNFFGKMERAREFKDLLGDENFASCCNEVIQSTNILRSSITDNAVSLGVYKKTRIMLLEKGEPEFLDINPEIYVRNFGFYGFTVIGSSYGSLGQSIKLRLVPLEELGVLDWAVLDVDSRKPSIQYGKVYRKELPKFTNLRLFKPKARIENN